jgi:hypothetical protein
LDLATADAQVKGEASERAGRAMTEFQERFSDQWQASGVEPLGEFLDTLPEGERSEAIRLLGESTTASLLSGLGHSAQETEDEWAAGTLRVVQRDEDGVAVRWRKMTILDPEALAMRSKLVEDCRSMRAHLDEFCERFARSCPDKDALVAALEQDDEFGELAVRTARFEAYIDAIGETYGFDS